MNNYTTSMDELYHYGVKGMKWGVRRFDNDTIRKIGVKTQAVASNVSAGARKYSNKAADYYENKSNKKVAKISKSKTKFGKRWNNLSAYGNENMANVIRSVNKEKSLLKKADNLVGAGKRSTHQKSAANYYNREAEYSKTRLDKTKNKSRAYNFEQYSKATARIHDSKTLQEAGERCVDAVLNTKVKTWSGRTMTSGQKIVENMLTLGIGNVVADVKYYRSNK